MTNTIRKKGFMMVGIFAGILALLVLIAGILGLMNTLNAQSGYDKLNEIIANAAKSNDVNIRNSAITMRRGMDAFARAASGLNSRGVIVINNINENATFNGQVNGMLTPLWVGNISSFLIFGGVAAIATYAILQFVSKKEASNIAITKNQKSKILINQVYTEKENKLFKWISFGGVIVALGLIAYWILGLYTVAGQSSIVDGQATSKVAYANSSIMEDVLNQLRVQFDRVGAGAAVGYTPAAVQTINNGSKAANSLTMITYIPGIFMIIFVVLLAIALPIPHLFVSRKHWAKEAPTSMVEETEDQLVSSEEENSNDENNTNSKE